MPAAGAEEGLAVGLGTGAAVLSADGAAPLVKVEAVGVVVLVVTLAAALDVVLARLDALAATGVIVLVASAVDAGIEVPAAGALAGVAGDRVSAPSSGAISHHARMAIANAAAPITAIVHHRFDDGRKDRARTGIDDD